MGQNNAVVYQLLPVTFICSMIGNFPLKRAYNQGGYKSFVFIPKHLVATYPMISNAAAVVPAGLAAGAAWLNGYATAQTLNYREETQTDANGNYYMLTVGGFVPGERPELIDLMNLMPEQRYVVVICDRYGMQRLVGSPLAPLDFKAEFNSGTARADQRGFNFTFTGLSLFRAPAYNF